ncbi:MAG: BamA/TamA family outer membrane protein [Thiotrichales bacterium]|nr:BamA/TamA family outer membrane protein [Thiotrichales bacterium]
MNRAPTMPGGWVGICAAAVLLAAVTLTAAHAQTPVVRFEVERFVVEGDSPLSEVRTREVLQPFTGEHAGVDGLLAAADALERAIQAAGIPFQRVMLPPQTLDDGEVVLRLMVFEVERVEVEGASHHSEANVRRSVPALREGKTPDTDAIARNLAVANRLPWKTTNLTFRESEDSIAGLDARLEVEDRRPWLLWSGLDNTGDASSGRFRWSVGANAGNLFDRDHSVNASYTTSPGHTGQIAQWAVGYGLPVYGLGGMLSAYYVRSDADSGRVLDVLDVSGAGAFAGVAYAQELRRSGNLSHRLSIGIDDRRFENRLVLAGSEVDVAPPPVRSFPLTLTYGAEYAGVDWGADLRVRFARNIESGVDNDDSVYGSNRAGAKAGWDVLRGSATIFWPLPAQWSGRALFEVQKANEPLIAGEQFGLGGAGSVRGFSEREVAGDDGVRGSLELWTPALSDGELRFVLFADAGRVINEPAGGLAPRENLASVGAGMRWNWKEHAALTLDFGAIVNGTITRESGVRGHLNLVVQY